MYVNIYSAQHASQMEDIKVRPYSEIIKKIAFGNNAMCTLVLRCMSV